MKPFKKLWELIQGDPVFMRKVNGYLTVFWVFMIPISIITGWISSVAYVSALSLWALVAGHWSAWAAARVEVRQDEELKEREENPPEQKVVEELVKNTTIEQTTETNVEDGDVSVEKTIETNVEETEEKTTTSEDE